MQSRSDIQLELPSSRNFARTRPIFLHHSSSRTFTPLSILVQLKCHSMHYYIIGQVIHFLVWGHPIFLRLSVRPSLFTIWILHQWIEINCLTSCNALSLTVFEISGEMSSQNTDKNLCMENLLSVPVHWTGILKFAAYIFTQRVKEKGGER